jgi:hypothetical protein
VSAYGTGVYGAGVYGAGAGPGGLGLTLTLQAVYPNRVLVAATGLTVDDLVTVSRVPAGSTQRTAVRGMNQVTMTTTTLVKADAEAPFGVPLTYYLTINGTDTDNATITLSLDKVALSDAINGNAAEVVILAWPEKRRDRASTVYPVGGRNIVVVGQQGGFSGSIDLFVETDAAKNNVLSTIQNATSGTLQLRADNATTSDGVDCYISILSASENRYSQDGSDERRILSLDVAESTPWGPALESPTFTLADIANAYPSPNDLNDIASDFTTLLDIALGDFS